MSVTVSGGDEFTKALGRLEVEAVSADTAKRGGDIIERQAKRNSRSRRVRRTARVIAKDGQAVIQFGSRAVPWTGPSHFGHGSPGRPRAQGGWMRANPFLHDAVDRRETEVVDLFVDDLNGAMRKLGLS